MENDDAENPVIAYDPEVEKKRIKVQEKVNQGWQKIVSDHIGNVINIWEKSKKIEYDSAMTISKWTFLSLMFIFFIISVLTFVGKVSGDALIFFTGTLVGYMLSFIHSKPPSEEVA